MKNQTTLSVLALLLCASASAQAAVYTVNYTGIVDNTFLYGSAPLPAGVSIGSSVSGSFAFDSAAAASPTYTFGSCSGSCGGGSVTASFLFSAGLSHTVSIAGHTWSDSRGKVALSDNALIPGGAFQSIGVDSSVTADDPLLSFALTSPPTQLFPDVNVLTGLAFGNAALGFGIIRNSDYYISFALSLPVQETASAVPLPAAAWLFGPALLGFAFKRRKA
ncbi:MAG: hypothetical protein ACKN9T_00790 [Candidatus Methylumidiphilus sp.]